MPGVVVVVQGGRVQVEPQLENVVWEKAYEKHCKMNALLISDSFINSGREPERYRARQGDALKNAKMREGGRQTIS